MSDMKYKQAIVVRSDLEMSMGKFGVQCAHASEESVAVTNPEIVDKWREEGFRKIVLQVPDEKAFISIFAECVQHGVSCFLVEDFGLTELEPNTVTCLGIGPDVNEKIDKITGRLKLWKKK